MKTPGNQIKYVDKNGKIYNTIFTFKEDAPTKKRMVNPFKRRKRSATDMSY